MAESWLEGLIAHTLGSVLCSAGGGGVACEALGALGGDAGDRWGWGCGDVAADEVGVDCFFLIKKYKLYCS